MPRPRSLSHDQLAAAALAVLDRDGLAALSMRAVAKELGMSTMALYRYVRDRDELELLVVEFVLAAVDTGAPDAGLSWRARIEVLVRRIRRSLIAYVNGALQLEHLGALSGAGTAAISALPPEDFPLMAATGRSARQVDPEREFFGGLAVLLRGLAD